MTSLARASVRMITGEFVRSSLRLVALGLLVACGGGGDGITVNANVAGVRFVTQPGSVAVGQPFTVSVELITSGGTRATAATNVVTLTASGATLSGATSVAAVAGLATFTGLTMTSGGTGVQLQAAAAGFSTSSVAFTSTDPCGPVVLAVPGNANGTINDTSCLLSGLRVALFRFAATGSGGNMFNVNAAFPARVEVTTVPAGDNVSFVNSQGAQVSGEWLLPAGTYHFRVSARSGSGAFSLAATNPPGNQGCNTRAFVIGGIYTQTLASTDCVFNDGSYYDVFLVYSTRACNITMRSADIDSWLEVFDAVTGNSIAFNDDDGGGVNGLDATISRPACNSGGNPIGIAANSASAADIGTYNLSLQFTGAAVVADSPETAREMPVVTANFAPKPVAKPAKRQN